MREKRSFKLIDRWVGIPLLMLLGLALRLGRLAGRGEDRPLRRGDRVLVAKLSALGDTLLLLPVLKALRQAVGPEGRVEMVVSEVNHAAVEGCPWVDGVLVPDLARMIREPWYGWLFLKGLRSRGYSHALDFDQWLRATPLICCFGGAQRLYGFHTSGQHRHYLNTHGVPNTRGLHESVQFAALAVRAGADPAAIEPAHGFLARHLKAWKAAPGARPPRALPGLPKGRGPLVVLHPGCGSNGWQRAWPEDRYAGLARRLLHGGARVVLTGHGAFEAALCAKTEAAARQGSAKPLALVNLAGRLDFAGLRALLGQSRLLVSGNTGVMHLAALMGTPLVALHGPTDPVKWGPLPGQCHFPLPGSAPSQRSRISGSASATVPTSRFPLPGSAPSQRSRISGSASATVPTSRFPLPGSAPSQRSRISGSASATVPTSRTVVLSAHLPCSPCLNLGHEYGCRARPCMEAIPQDAVERACLTLLKGH